MKLLSLNTEILGFENSYEFAKELNLNSKDLIFTNKRIYEGSFKDLSLKCNYIFKDKYNFNEPNDEVIDEIFKDIKKIDFNS